MTIADVVLREAIMGLTIALGSACVAAAGVLVVGWYRKRLLRKWNAESVARRRE